MDDSYRAERLGLWPTRKGDSLTDPLAEPDRIAFAGDWHGDTNWACQTVWQAHKRGADVLVHLGDTGYQFRPLFLTRLDAALAKAKMPMMFVDGNHDDHQWLAGQRIGRNGLRRLTDRIWHIPRGFRWQWGGLTFCGLGGAHSVDATYRRRGGLMWQPQERITDEQAALVKAGGLCDVLISHDCPAGVAIPGLHSEDFPPLEILRAEEHRELMRTIVDVIRPRAIWHGHYHVRYEQAVDFGWGRIDVRGLAENRLSVDDNLHVIGLDELSASLEVRR